MAAFLMHYEDVVSDKVLVQQVTQLRDAAKMAKLGVAGAEDIVLRLMSQQIRHQHAIDTAADSLIVTAQAIPGANNRGNGRRKAAGLRPSRNARTNPAASA